MPTSRTSVIEAMMNKFVDIAVFGPYSYAIAIEKDKNIEVFATYAKAKGIVADEGLGYKAVLITKRGSKFTSIESLKGTTLALTDPASTSGTLIPRITFTKVIKMPHEADFKKVVFSGEHDLSTMTAKDGKVDAAFVATHRLDEVINRGMAKNDDFIYP